MKIVQKKDNQVIFTVEIEETLANGIRRYLNHVPVLAIDEVEISKNDSPLYDETVAHRMGLIPLKTDKAINDKSKYELKLSVNKEGAVYSGELKGSVKPTYENIPITSLKKGQELEINAVAKSGLGKEHAKFSPGLMSYRNTVNVNVEKNCPKEVIETCPQEILKIKNGKVDSEEEYKCDMCEACTDFCNTEKNEFVKLVPTKELLINLESFGQIDTNKIFEKSIEALKKDLALVSKKIGK